MFVGNPLTAPETMVKSRETTYDWDHSLGIFNLNGGTFNSYLSWVGTTIRPPEIATLGSASTTKAGGPSINHALIRGRCWYCGKPENINKKHSSWEDMLGNTKQFPDFGTWLCVCVFIFRSTSRCLQLGPFGHGLPSTLCWNTAENSMDV